MKFRIKSPALLLPTLVLRNVTYSEGTDTKPHVTGGAYHNDPLSDHVHRGFIGREVDMSLSFMELQRRKNAEEEIARQERLKSLNGLMAPSVRDYTGLNAADENRAELQASFFGEDVVNKTQPAVIGEVHEEQRILISRDGKRVDWTWWNEFQKRWSPSQLSIKIVKFWEWCFEERPVDVMRISMLVLVFSTLLVFLVAMCAVCEMAFARHRPWAPMYMIPSRTAQKGFVMQHCKEKYNPESPHNKALKSMKDKHKTQYHAFDDTGAADIRPDGTKTVDLRTLADKKISSMKHSLLYKVEPTFTESQTTKQFSPSRRSTTSGSSPPRVVKVTDTKSYNKVEEVLRPKMKNAAPLPSPPKSPTRYGSL